ncbi:Multifunctional pyrimidine synthesis protein CAD [Serendipita sp. 407]|nr:Multifunctional pyrimidine synthesis protein CAD [Serendipita sp. 407]
MLGSIARQRTFFLYTRSTAFRGLATHAPSTSTTKAIPAVLHLKTGQSFTGKSFGSPKSVFGETVFSTSITSYTRAITRILRDQGTTLGRLAVGEDVSAPPPAPEEYWDPTTENLVDQVSVREPYTLNPSGDVRIAVLDFGAKANILRSLVRRGASCTVLPWNHDFNAIRDQFDGLFLSNGPGDPAHTMEAAMKLRKTFEEWDKPIFGICMGHQVIGMAAGLEAYRMTFGNRGHNQPVLALASSGSVKAGRVYVTSQNHQYALKLQDPFPAGWEPFFINCNDSSVEGIKSTPESGRKIWGVQFHPESAGGPLDTIEMFTDFLTECRNHKAHHQALESASMSSPNQSFL